MDYETNEQNYKQTSDALEKSKQLISYLNRPYGRCTPLRANQPCCSVIGICSKPADLEPGTHLCTKRQLCNYADVIFNEKTGLATCKTSLTSIPIEQDWSDKKPYDHPYQCLSRWGWGPDNTRAERKSGSTRATGKEGNQEIDGNYEFTIIPDPKIANDKSYIKNSCFDDFPEQVKVNQVNFYPATAGCAVGSDMNVYTKKENGKNVSHIECVPSPDVVWNSNTVSHGETCVNNFNKCEKGLKCTNITATFLAKNKDITVPTCVDPTLPLQSQFYKRGGLGFGARGKY